MMRKLSYLPAAWPGLLYALPLLAAYLLWGERDSFRWHKDAWFWSLRADSWPRRTWYKSWGGTTFGHVVMTRPRLSGRLVAHELVHVEQFDAQSLLGLVIAAVLLVLGHPWWLGLLAWVAVPGANYVTAGIVAALRGESFYRGNHLEEGAYDATKESA
jgi:hypothetical protein